MILFPPVPNGIRQMNSGPVTLAFRGGAFFAGVGGKAVRLRAMPAPEPAPGAASFRRDARYVVWDSRGLTIRTAQGTYTTRLEELAVSGKLFERAEVANTVRLIKAGVRRKAADSLSGAVRIGTDVFLLPRWTDSRGETWLEALVRVPLTGSAIKPVLLGRFAGLTTAYRPVDDELTLAGGRPVAIVRTKDSWGVAGALPATREFGYVPLGTNLLWTSGGAYAERTNYGSVMVGTLDRRGLSRTMTLEARTDLVEPVDRDGRLVRWFSDGATTLADARSGAQVRLAGELVAAPVAASGRGMVLLFDDPARPRRAVLVGAGSGGGLEPLAEWVERP